MLRRSILLALLVSASGELHAQSHAARDSSLARQLVTIADSLKASKPDTVRLVRVDTVVVVKRDTVFVKDTTVATVPPVTSPPAPSLWSHPYPPLPDSTAYAEFPRESVTVVIPGPTRTIPVVSLQAALDTAKTGDLLKIPANHTTDDLMVRPTSRALWVTVQGTDSTSVIQTRVGGSTSAVNILPQAHHVRFLGPLSIRAATDATNAIVRSYNAETSTAQLAHDFIFDGVTIDSRGFQVRRCAWPDGIRMAIVNSKLLGCANSNGDAQGILNAQGGPYRYQGNYIEGGHQCYMTGGVSPSIVGDVPKDVYFADNYCFKPYYWHFTTPGVYVGRERQVKTIIESKKVLRALYERNILRNVYADAQAGFCGLFKSENQGGDPNAQTKDVTFRYNWCDSTASGLNIAAHPVRGLSLTRFTAYDNRFTNISTRGGEGLCVQILDDVVDVALIHNTFGNCGNNAISFDGGANVRTAIVSNIIPTGAYGVKGNSTGIGNATINKWILPTGLFSNNAIIGADCSQYPTSTICRTPIPAGLGADSTKIPR